MKHLLLLCPLLLSGCVMLGMPNIEKILKAAKDDHSSLTLKFPTPWGPAELSRANPGTNTLAHTFAPEGKIEVKK